MDSAFAPIISTGAKGFATLSSSSIQMTTLEPITGFGRCSDCSRILIFSYYLVRAGNDGANGGGAVGVPWGAVAGPLPDDGVVNGGGAVKDPCGTTGGGGLTIPFGCGPVVGGPLFPFPNVPGAGLTTPGPGTMSGVGITFSPPVCGAEVWPAFVSFNTVFVAEFGASNEFVETIPLLLVTRMLDCRLESLPVLVRTEEPVPSVALLTPSE